MKKSDYAISLFNHWMSKKNLMSHRSKTIKAEMAIIKTLKDYTYEELVKAIDNYDKVMGAPPNTYLGQYKHGIRDFFRAGVQKDPPFLKFLGEATPFTNLLIDKSKIKTDARAAAIKRQNVEFETKYSKDTNLVSADEVSKQIQKILGKTK